MTLYLKAYSLFLFAFCLISVVTEKSDVKASLILMSYRQRDDFYPHLRSLRNLCGTSNPVDDVIRNLIYEEAKDLDAILVSVYFRDFA